MVNIEEALKKLQRYCAYQDRCHQEVRTKLLSLKVYGDDLEEVIVALIEDNFLNEERYARSFARGKFNIRKWGRNKIKQQLKQKNVSAYCIKKGLEEIEEADYLKTLSDLVVKKEAERAYQKLELYPRKQKLALYLINRGYESHLVWKAVANLK